MRLFLDTEFTNLIPGNKLISIALVDEDENYFYAELTDTYTLADCSDFVVLDVLPLLRGNCRMTHRECALAIGNWIDDRSVPCIIASDSPGWDMPHLVRLLEDLWPANLEKLCIPIRVTDADEIVLVAKFGYDIHNALDDALVMKKAVLGY